MHEPLLPLLANGFVPGRDIGVPEGREAVYHWAGPILLSLAILVLGLWLARVRHVRTGSARALVWAGVGFLVVSCTAWGLGAHEGTGVFYPGWASWWAFPILASLAGVWWLARVRLARLGPLRPRLEVIAWCSTVGFVCWWISWLTSDLNWMHWSWQKSIVLTAPWLWAGACGFVIWSCWWSELSEARRRIRAACIVGGIGGFVAACLVNSLAGILLGWGRPHRLDRGLSLLLSAAAFGVFVFGGAAISVWLRRGAWIETQVAPVADEPQSSPAPEPVSTSSG